VEFWLLGPFEVDADGRRLSLGGPQARAVLALLLLHRNEVVSVDRIVDELWSEQPPRSAEQAVRVYVSHLRKALEPRRADGPPEILLTRGNGYLLRVERGEVDVDHFEARRAQGQQLLALGDPDKAVAAFDEAMSLWRGPPLQDFVYDAFAHPEIARLEELRLTTLEDRFDAQLAAGQGSRLVPDLTQHVEANPLRERLRAQLMLALYRSGRQADAIETYQRGRQRLVEELGLEPSESLQRLESRILQHDPSLDPPTGAWSVDHPGPRPRSRRLLTRGVAASLVAIGVIAGSLVAATTGGTARPQSVALVVSSSRSDLNASGQGWFDEIDAMRSAARAAGVGATVVYGGNPIAGFLRALASAARRYDLVIVGATPNLQQVSELTRRFPGTRFLVPDSVTDPLASFAGQANVTGINFDDHERAYLGGYLAGLMTHGRQAVSVVGGIPTQVVRNLVDGFAAGAHAARPGVRVLVSYADTFVDESPCATKANQQIDRGSEVVFDAAGLCGFGALQAAGIRGVWGLGVDDNMAYLGPQILASVVKNANRATTLAINLFAQGVLPEGQDLQLNLATGGIGIAGISPRVPPAVRARVEAVAARLIARDQARAPA
jgi:DNA-binding SARP family transcriptional activator/basic membrane lipoprotein Med (substrate-binding protein (PBP1-ABC) superfamily)